MTPLMTDLCSLQCAFTEASPGPGFSVSLYNPLASVVSSPVRLPVSSCSQSYAVTTEAGAVLASQLVPLPAEVLAIPGRDSSAVCELVFIAQDLPPLGVATFQVTKKEGETQKPTVESIKRRTNIFNHHLKISFSDSGKLSKIYTKEKSEIHLRQDFAYYRGAAGHNSPPLYEDRASGAYIFRPLHQEPEPVGDPLSASVIRGPVVQEVHQRFNNWTSQVIRLYTHARTVEFEWMVGPLPQQEADTPGLEVITRYTTDLQTEDRFLTDSNGRFMIERRRDSRPTWDLNLTEPVASNYYPVDSRLALVEDSNEVSTALIMSVDIPMTP